jgi:hypothetical protein
MGSPETKCEENTDKDEIFIGLNDQIIENVQF